MKPDRELGKITDAPGGYFLHVSALNRPNVELVEALQTKLNEAASRFSHSAA